MMIFTGQSNRENVCMQETRKKAYKETQRRSNGVDRETDIATNQFAVRRQPCVRIRDQGRTVSRAYYYER